MPGESRDGRRPLLPGATVMQRVAGIGGVFLYSPDAAAMAEWYRDVLGVPLEHNEECNNYYCMLNSTDAEAAGGPGTTVVFSIMPSPHTSGLVQQACMMNFRVGDLNAFVAQLRQRGVKIDKTEDYDYGKFAWIMDPHGNKIELYQPLA
jgi:catechol 2,3-dioxygenase-like lactoylglutathione lyase family enzyme